MSPQLLAVHPRPVVSRGGSTNVDELRLRTDADPPARLLQTQAQIDLFVEHEETRIEEAYLLDGFSPEQECGADQESLSEMRSHRSNADRRGCGGDRRPARPPTGRQPDQRRLRSTMRIVKLRPDRPERWLSRGACDEVVDAVLEGPGIRVEQQDERRAGYPEPLVAGGAVPDVLRQLDQPDLLEALADEVARPVDRGVVHDDHLSTTTDDGGQGPLEVGARVVGDDDDGKLTHVRASAEPGAAATIGIRHDRDELRILVALPYTPRGDARHGGKAMIPLLLRLGERHRVALVHLRRADDEQLDEALQERCELVDAVTVPDPSDHSRRFKRAAHLIHGFIKGRPIQVGDLFSREYSDRLRSIAERWRPDVIQIELEAMAQYLQFLEQSPGRRLLVLHEPAVQTADEVWRISSGLERVVRLLDWSAWRRFERSVAARADAVVVLTETDRKAALGVSAGRPIYTIPLTAELPIAPLDPLGAIPPSVIFVGGFGHAPNVEAARGLALRILPRVRERRPETMLYLVGDRPSAGVRALARNDVIVTGGVPDVASYLDRAAVVAAPLRVGGGMRLKVIEALAAGKALVATPRAVEGLGIRDGEHALIADTDAAFADALVRVLDDRDERRRLAAGGRNWAEKNLDPALAVAAYERVYDEVLSEPDP